jgi:hypothetical protein
MQELPFTLQDINLFSSMLLSNLLTEHAYIDRQTTAQPL